MHLSYLLFSASSSTIFHSSEFGSGGCCLRHNKIGILIFFDTNWFWYKKNSEVKRKIEKCLWVPLLFLSECWCFSRGHCLIFFQHAENCWIRNFNGGQFLTFLNTNWSWVLIFTNLGSIFWIFKSASASSLSNFFTVFVLDSELFSSSSFWVLDFYGLFCEWRIRGRGVSWFFWVWDDELYWIGGVSFFFTQ